MYNSPFNVGYASMESTNHDWKKKIGEETCTSTQNTGDIFLVTILKGDIKINPKPGFTY